MKIELNDISYWEVARHTNADSQFKGQNEMIEAMRDLYPIVKEHIHESSWKIFEESKHPTLHDTFEFFLDAIEHGLEKEGTTYEIAYYTEWVIEMFKESHNRIDSNVFVMPMVWLYDLERSSKDYFKIVYTMYHLLSKEKHFWIHGDDGYDDYYEDDIMNHIEEEPEAADDPQHKDILLQFEKLREFQSKHGVRLHKKMWTLKTLKKKISETKPSCKAEQSLLKWVKMGIKVLEAHGDMYQVTRTAESLYCAQHDIDIDEDGNYGYFDNAPVIPGQVCRFGWIDSAYHMEWYIQWINEHAGNYGSAGYAYKIECQSPTDIYEMDDCPDSQQEFIELTEEFFTYGLDRVELFSDYAKGDWKVKIFGVNDETIRLPVERSIENIPAIG